MKKQGVLLSVLILLLPAFAAAETLTLPRDLAFTFTLADSWVFSQEPPDFLIEETVEHVQHDLEDENREVPIGEIRAAVGQRLAANEGFVYNPKSRSMLLLDFSPLRSDEKAPSEETVARSARYAAGELKGEEGIEEVDAETRKTGIDGLTHAYRIDADYLKHGEPRHFLGIVGFSDPYWVFLYYTDTRRNASDLPAIERLLEGARLHAQP